MLGSKVRPLSREVLKVDGEKGGTGYRLMDVDGWIG